MRDGDDAGLLRGCDKIALVNKAEAGAARDGRADRRIVELRRRRVDGRRVRGDLRDQLRDQGILGVELLLRRITLLGERRVPLQIELGVGEVRLILRLFGFGLIERRLKWTRVNLREQIACLDHLSFLKGYYDDLPVDSRAHGDGIESLHLAEAFEIDGIIGAPGPSDRYGDRNGRFGRGLRRRGSALRQRGGQKIVQFARIGAGSRGRSFGCFRRLKAWA